MRLASKVLLAVMYVLVQTPVSAQDELDLLLLQEGVASESLPPAETDKAATADDDVYEDFIEVAQPTPTPEVGRQPERSRQLEEIIVTAQKKTSTLQDTPISMEAFGAEKLELRGIGGLEDLGTNVPSMIIEPFPLSATTLRIAIRGVGVNDSQVTQDPAVGIYIDGVYLARSVGLALDLADVERMEVLRGPQGVLYGRNSTGGAINVISKRPDPLAFNMQHKLTVGERNLLSARSSINVPLTDDLAVKLALVARRSDGFVENTGERTPCGPRNTSILSTSARSRASPTDRAR